MAAAKVQLAPTASKQPAVTSDPDGDLKNAPAVAPAESERHFYTLVSTVLFDAGDVGLLVTVFDTQQYTGRSDAVKYGESLAVKYDSVIAVVSSTLFEFGKSDPFLDPLVPSKFMVEGIRTNKDGKAEDVRVIVDGKHARAHGTPDFWDTILNVFLPDNVPRTAVITSMTLL